MASDYFIYYLTLKIIIMKLESMKKFSLLGLVLIAASAVTAAILPKSDTKQSFGAKDGRLQASTGGVSCKANLGGETCDASTNEANKTATSGEGQTDSENDLITDTGSDLLNAGQTDTARTTTN